MPDKPIGTPVGYLETAINGLDVCHRLSVRKHLRSFATFIEIDMARWRVVASHAVLARAS